MALSVGVCICLYISIPGFCVPSAFMFRFSFKTLAETVSCIVVSISCIALDMTFCGSGLSLSDQERIDFATNSPMHARFMLFLENMIIVAEKREEKLKSTKVKNDTDDDDKPKEEEQQQQQEQEQQQEEEKQNETKDDEKVDE